MCITSMQSIEPYDGLTKWCQAKRTESGKWNSFRFHALSHWKNPFQMKSLELYSRKINLNFSKSEKWNEQK